MMNEKLKSRIKSKTKDLINCPNARNKHFTFIVKRNRILVIGWNSYDRTHPVAKIFGHRFSCVHSEIAAIAKIPLGTDITKCVMINTRINSFGKFGMSRPCKKCVRMLDSLGINFRKIFFTNEEGIFSKM